MKSSVGSIENAIHPSRLAVAEHIVRNRPENLESGELWEDTVVNKDEPFFDDATVSGSTPTPHFA